MEIPLFSSERDIVRDLRCQQMEKLADQLGIDYIYRRNFWGPQWTSRQLVLDSRDPAAYFFHEVIHWLVATPEERGMFNYGLGGDEVWSEASSGVFEADWLPYPGKTWKRRGFKNSGLVSLERSNIAETHAVNGFLLIHHFIDGFDVQNGWNYWGEFSGDSGLKKGESEVVLVNKSLRYIAKRLKEHGIVLKNYLLTTGPV